MLTRDIFKILTPQNPFSWVSESFRQDIFWLSKPFSRFQLETVFEIFSKVFAKNIFIIKNLNDFCKTVETAGMDPRLDTVSQATDIEGKELQWRHPTGPSVVERERDSD